MTIHQTFSGSLLLLFLTTCGQSLAKSRTSPLDYAELSRNDGWYLRIHGDGSGTLTHRQYPQHHLDYPLQTFDLGGIQKAALPCISSSDTQSCYSLTYYRSAADRTQTCSCAPSGPLDEAMNTAIANMQLTVDDQGSERSCRMLRRVWLAAR